MHSIASISHRYCTLLNVRELECFCVKCIDDNFDFYEMKSHVKPWRLLTLEPLNMSQVPSSNFKVFLFMVFLFCPHLLEKNALLVLLMIVQQMSTLIHGLLFVSSSYHEP